MLPQKGSEGVDNVEDRLRDCLERLEIMAETAGFPVIRHLAAMGLLELNELDGRGRLQAMMLRESARKEPT